jgi:DNA-binding transcriptional LysR family regulator
MLLDAFCALDHVVVSPRGAAFIAQTDEGLAAIGRRRKVRLAVPHFLLVPEILARTDMIAVLPERLARGYGARLAVMELPIDMAPFTIAAVWHERSHRGPPQAWLREALANLMHADELPLPTRPRGPARVNPPGGARRA